MATASLVVCGLLLSIVPIIASGAGTALVIALLTLSLLIGLAAISLSALLYLDAALFMLMASHSDVTQAGGAVDDLLARTRLKAAPVVTRPLEDRIAGARRLIGRQQVALAAFIVTTVLALALNFA